MREIKIGHHISCPQVVPVAWSRHAMILGILGFVMVLFSGIARSTPTANPCAGQTPDAQVSQPTHATEEEENAYRAAKQEPDPRKRAEKLYAYFQKYPKSVLMLRADFEVIRPIEDEYSAYYAASQEPDFRKRAALLINFLQTFSQSTLVGNIKDDYLQMLKASAKEKKFELLDSLAEKWLELRPADRQVSAFAVEASIGLKEYRKAGEYLESLYRMQPSIPLAKEIIAAYENAGDMKKQVEWGEKLFKLPELADDYMLRYSFVMQFYKRNQIQTAAEYARLAIKAAGLASAKNAAEQEQLQNVRSECRHIIASDLMDRGDYAGAISMYQEAIRERKYAEGYYRIGQILDGQKEVEKAMHYYAMADLVGGEDAAKANARLEMLYKTLHNDTLIGIDKVYKKAEAALAETGNKP